MDPFLERYRKKFYRLFLLRWMNSRYIRRPVIFEAFLSPDPAKLFVLTIAFNENEVISLQDIAIKKFLEDSYEYFVLDNSNDATKSAAIKSYCIEHGINYAKLPENKGWNGMSHGFALNWAYRNVVQRYKPAEFGFIDHDMFPIASVSIKKYLAQGDAWGITVEDKRPTFRPWDHDIHLFMGLAFYRREKFRQHTPNFFPGFGVDTGGRIRIKREDMAKLPDIHEFYHPEPIIIAPGVKVSRYGNFVHFEAVAHTAGSLDELAVEVALKKRWLAAILGSELR